MRARVRRFSRAVALISIVAVSAVGCSSGSDDDVSTVSPSTTSDADAGAVDFTAPSGAVRGFDGRTIRIASIGIKSRLPSVETGVRARINRFNDTNEIPGVRLDFVEFVDDKVDAATSLSEARRLVTAENVFAIVGDVSRTNPLAYFKQQKVPYFGIAFDPTYCSTEPDASVWGFGFNGCLTNPDIKVAPDANGQLYEYASKKLGKKAPTIALLSGDNDSGRSAVRTQEATAAGAGFDVVYAKGIVPDPPVADFTPFAQALLSADGGNPPDVIVCLLSVDCVPLYKLLLANDYKGLYAHALAVDILVEPLKGSLATSFWATDTDASNPALDQIRADIAAVDSKATLEFGTGSGYFSTDMFIQALETVAKAGTKYISPENVRLAAAHQTWEVEGVAGPTRYPESTVRPTPLCNSLIMSNGTKWVTIGAFGCSEKTHPVP